jgi:hypothetical protein
MARLLGEAQCLTLKCHTCGTCGRKTVVEVGQFGISHIMGVIATCWDCLDPAARAKAGELYSITDENFDKALAE